jgi:iron complex transport system substrate-binding protein
MSARSASFRLLAVVLAAAIGMLPTACAAADPVVVRDDRGVEHRFAEPPRRLVTMLPSLTETAWVLGAGDRLVGVDRFSNWPAEIAALPHLGGLDDAQIESIAKMRPDVVLASTSARSLDRLESLGFTVVRLKSESHADVRRTMNLVAMLLGTPGAGAREWARIERVLAAAAERVPPQMRGRTVYFEIGGGPYAAGTTSFIGETLARLGMRNVVAPDLGPFPKLNPEYVVRARPDVIMGVQREQTTVIARPGWSEIPAIRDRRLCGFPTDRYEVLIRPGPRMGEAAALLAECLASVAQQR